MFPVRVLRAYVHDETSPPVKTKSTLSDEEDETDTTKIKNALNASGFKGGNVRYLREWLNKEHPEVGTGAARTVEQTRWEWAR